MEAGSGELAPEMRRIGQAARAAARELALVPRAVKDRALRRAADRLRAAAPELRLANALDLVAAEDNGMSGAGLDRLALTPPRIEAMARGLAAIAEQEDPVGREIARWTRPNGLDIARVRVPLGVVGIIYESRPNVTADAGALCLKAGNATILRGGSDSFGTSRLIHACLVEALRDCDLPEAAIQYVPTADRAAVGMMLAGLDGAIDVIVPRGGKTLVARVQDEARVPVLAHLEGNCHVYVHARADIGKARRIVINAKMRRTGVCGAAETLLIDRTLDPRPFVEDLLDAGCEVRGDAAIRALDTRVVPAAEADWATEYLDAIIAVKVVDGLDAAIDHIEGHGSHHTDAIVTEDKAVAETFAARIDSAIVLINASTQFADGGEFGFGGEIGIATGRLHARGPVGVEQLTTFKYVIRGDGQVRP